MIRTPPLLRIPHFSKQTSQQSCGQVVPTVSSQWASPGLGRGHVDDDVPCRMSILSEVGKKRKRNIPMLHVSVTYFSHVAHQKAYVSWAATAGLGCRPIGLRQCHMSLRGGGGGPDPLPHEIWQRILPFSPFRHHRTVPDVGTFSEGGGGGEEEGHTFALTNLKTEVSPCRF